MEIKCHECGTTTKAPFMVVAKRDTGKPWLGKQIVPVCDKCFDVRMEETSKKGGDMVVGD
jgi:hypothetical protein